MRARGERWGVKGIFSEYVCENLRPNLRVRVRGENGISDGLSPSPFPSPLKGEGFLCPSVFSREVFHNFFDIIILDITWTHRKIRPLALSP